MLVKFNSKVGSIVMFGEVAVALIKMMGHSGTVPSALLAADIPAALENLKRAAAIAPDSQPEGGKEEKEDEAPRVSLHQRAYPLIKLLTQASERGCDVVWDEDRPFLKGML